VPKWQLLSAQLRADTNGDPQRYACESGRARVVRAGNWMLAQCKVTWAKRAWELVVHRCKEAMPANEMPYCAKMMLERKQCAAGALWGGVRVGWRTGASFNLEGAGRPGTNVQPAQGSSSISAACGLQPLVGFQKHAKLPLRLRVIED